MSAGNKGKRTVALPAAACISASVTRPAMNSSTNSPPRRVEVDDRHYIRKTWAVKIEVESATFLARRQYHERSRMLGQTVGQTSVPDG